AELTKASSGERNLASEDRSAASTMVAEARPDPVSRLTRWAAASAEARSMSASTTEPASPRSIRSKAAAVPWRPAPRMPYLNSAMSGSNHGHLPGTGAKEQGIERWRPCVPIGCPLSEGFRSPATDRAWVPPCDPLNDEPNPAEPMLRIGQIAEDRVRLSPHTYR